jgi:MoxR-like ATPase
MPTDIVGTNVWRAPEQAFQLVKGPIFTDVLLADEINRAPPKMQSALLEAMEEQQETIDGTTHPLGEYFFVVATQNPIELEGTYPLPEAQTDRFLVKLRMSYRRRRTRSSC